MTKEEGLTPLFFLRIPQTFIMVGGTKSLSVSLYEREMPASVVSVAVAGLRIPQTFIVVVNVTHDESITLAFKSHAVLVIYVGFEDAGMTSHRMGTQPGMTEISVKKTQSFISFSL